MSVQAATWIVDALSVYAAVGLSFALAFVAFGVGRIDARARGTSWPFRALILPGAALFWPLLATRLIRSRQSAEPPVEVTAHRARARRTGTGDRD